MADGIKVQLLKVRSFLDKFKPLQVVEEKTKVPKEYLVVGAGALAFLILLFSNGAGLLCNLVGFAIPSYFSFKAIESKSTDDDKQWLVYWVVFSFFNILESFLSIILYWIPFYFAFKLAFLIYLAHPEWKGASVIYENALKGLLFPPSEPSAVDKVKATIDAAGTSVITQLAGETEPKKDK